MRFSVVKFLAVGLAVAEVTAASTWFGKTAYNKWHETELERWLSDHDIPYPTPADRKDLETLVKNNWQANVVDTFAKAGDKSTEHYSNLKDWIFDSWTDSSLKSFLDHNKIPSPQPRTRDSLLTAARQNYDAIAKKLNEYTAYPGDWLYQSWSESDLKEFCDTRGIPVPQPSTRDKLVATVRRNARLASLNMNSAASSASASASSVVADVSKSASSASASLSDVLYDAWSESQLKEFLDKHGIPVPQGSKKNEMIALARRNAAKLTGNAASSVSASATSVYGAASSKAGNEFAKATDDAAAAAEDGFNKAVDTWSDSRLKAYLDARGVPVPQAGKRDELLAQVRLNRHKAATGWSAWTFDTWTVENLRKYLEANGKKSKKLATAKRDDLVKQAQEQYATASKKGGSQYGSVTNYLAKQTDAVKDAVFDTWSDSDVKAYLDTYGVPNYQGSTANELRAAAKRQATYFKYGTSTPQATFFEKVKGGLQWVLAQIQGGAQAGASQGSSAASSAASTASSVLSKSSSSLRSSIKGEL